MVVEGERHGARHKGVETSGHGYTGDLRPSLHGKGSGWKNRHGSAMPPSFPEPVLGELELVALFGGDAADRRRLAATRTSIGV
jgi:hypothetical protein